MREDLITWKIMENIKNPLDFIKMLYGNKHVNDWWHMMKNAGMGDNIFLENYDADLHEAVNDLYGRLRILGFRPDVVWETITYHGRKILNWKRMYDEVKA